MHDLTRSLPLGTLQAESAPLQKNYARSTRGRGHGVVFTRTSPRGIRYIRSGPSKLS